MRYRITAGRAVEVRDVLMETRRGNTAGGQKREIIRQAAQAQ